jgi:hypothetical protein
MSRILAAHTIARTLGVIAVANVLFVVLLLVSPHDPDRVAARITSAFATGDLSTLEYDRGDIRRGWHQYNDCSVLQMLSNHDSSRIAQSLAPRMAFLRSDADGNYSCGALRAIALDGTSRDSMTAFRYARYWHGYMVPVAFALEGMELVNLRRLLLLFVYAAIAVLSAAALRASEYTRRTGLAIAGTAALLWAAPYFAPSLTHGPGDAVLLLALAILILRPTIGTDLETLLPYAAAFGAVVVFFEMLTGQLPIAAGWLGALVLATARDETRPGALDARLRSIMALGAFAVGGVITVVVKQVLAALFAEPQAGAVFVSKLGAYAGIPASRNGIPGVFLPYIELVGHMYVLTVWRYIPGMMLTVVLAMALLWAVARGWRRRRTVQGQDVLFLVGLTLLPAMWVLVLPNHTFQHSSFMVRMMVVPISLALLALLWPSDQPMAGERSTGHRSLAVKSPPEFARSNDSAEMSL